MLYRSNSQKITIVLPKNMLWYFSHINFSYYHLFFKVLFIKLLFSIYAKENYQISEIEQKQECLNKILLAVANTKKVE